MRRSRGWLVLIATGFGVGLSFPYLGLDMSRSRIDAHGSQLHYGVLVVHILTATVALLLGSLQFVPKVRARKPVHRTLGRVYLIAGVVPSAATVVPVAVWFGRPLTQIALITAAVVWMSTAGLAYRAARVDAHDRHAEWMARNYAVTLLAITSRILVPLLIEIPFSGGAATSMGARAPSMIPVGQTLGWIINLTAVELLIRRRRGARRAWLPEAAPKARQPAPPGG